MASQDLTDVGTMPRLGAIPARMHAHLIRPERYGDPQSAFAVETVPTPRPGPGEALVYVMAAGVNYNNVWAALGRPVDVIAARHKAGETEDFHIGGSDASGIVWAVGEGVDSVRVGDHVVAHCGMWDSADPGSLPAATRSSRRARGSGDTRPTGGASRSTRSFRRINCCPSRPA